MSYLARKDRPQDLDVSFLFGETASNIRIRLNDRMYSIKRDVASNWVWHAFRGFEIIKRSFAGKQFTPRTFASIGSGSGVDAIGAARIFDTLETVIVTDVEPDIVEQAADNVRRNVSSHVKVVGLCGDVCFPLQKAGFKVDLAYANLPTIPISSANMIDHGTFYRQVRDHEATCAHLNKYLLGLQHRFLESAKHVLSAEGEVAFMIGGRISLEILDELASSCAFKLREVIASLKIQTEAENVTSGYAEWEKDGIVFDFYDYRKASALLSSPVELSGRELKALLRPAVISASAANKLVRNGDTVAHTLHMMAGRPL